MLVPVSAPSSHLDTVETCLRPLALEELVHRCRLYLLELDVAWQVGAAGPAGLLRGAQQLEDCLHLPDLAPAGNVDKK